MLDSTLRPYITPSLDKIAEKIDSFGIHANILTITALLTGLIGCFFVAIQSYFFGLIVILTSRLIDGLAGAMARRAGQSTFGSFLDSVCKTVFYAAFVFFFVLTLPVHMMAGLFLLFSYCVLWAGAAGYTAMMDSRIRTSGHESPGGAINLVGHTEIILLMVITCLFPALFSVMAFLFGILCWITVFSRAMQGWYAFGQNPDRADTDRQDDISA